MKNILILTDFSANAYHAAEYACSVAIRVEAKQVILLHTFDASLIFGPNETSALIGAVDAPGVYNNYEWVVEQSGRLFEEGLTELNKWKEKLIDKVGAQTTIKCRIENGPFHTIVNNICKEEKADLVVLGHKGKTGIEKILLGSNAAKAIEAVEYPLLIVPADVLPAAPEKIVLAADLKKVKQKYTALILKYLITHLKCKTLVLHVCTKDITEEKVQRCTSHINGFLGTLNPDLHFVQNTDVAKGIIKFAHDEKASMIISLHHSYDFLTGLFHKSITKELALQAKIPLLVLHTTV
jgi:nucleotide-binding universal stress UspA family protein